MLGSISVVVWLASLAVYVLCWIPSQRDVALRLDGAPMFVMHVAVVLLAGMALNASGSEESGARLTIGSTRAFYRRKPRFTWVVQAIAFALWIVSLVMLLSASPSGRVHMEDGHCIVHGVAIDDATCKALGVTTIRFFAGAWITFGWLAVAQFLFARPDERFALDDVK